MRPSRALSRSGHAASRPCECKGLTERNKGRRRRSGPREGLKPDCLMNRIVPLILAVALFMEQMDSTVISTSLPAIAADLGVGPITLKLALTSYMVSLATFIPLSGWMADRFGAKRIFRMAILVFVIGSILCAMSNSLIAFVVS